MGRTREMTGTCRQILDAATVAFSRKGFRATTIAEICVLAGTNLASVNYHFGDKENLYIEAWREAFRRSLEKHPPDGGVAPDAPVEERFRGRIMSIMGRVLDPECYDFEIAHMEIGNPTGILFDVIREHMEPLDAELDAIVRELLGPRATAEDVQLCSMSIRSQCLNPMVFGMRLGAHEYLPPGPPPLSPKLNLVLVADHVIRFSLAGIAEARRQIESRARAGKQPAARRR